MKKRFDKFDFIIFYLAISIFLFTSFIFFYRENFLSKDFDFSFYLLFGFSIIIIIFGFFLLNLIRKNPTTLTFSIVGFPHAGKTVYLTMLFDSLQFLKITKIQFSPFGQETIDRVFSDINKLSKGSWLPKTELGTVFYYRAIVNFSDSFFFNRKYMIEIADYAGEKTKELTLKNDKWLHKSDYFMQVIRSKVIFFALDCEELIDNDYNKINIIQNSFIAALYTIIEKKNLSEKQILDTPICLLFLKSDLLKSHNIESSLILDKVNNLLYMLDEKCDYFKYFFVSSVGKVTSNNLPPAKLLPENVIDPFSWALRHFR